MFRRRFLKTLFASIGGAFACFTARANGVIGHYVVPQGTAAMLVQDQERLRQIRNIDPQQLQSGQIYAGECLTSWEPSLDFRYVLLSCDQIDGTDEWMVAQFNMGFKSAKHFLNETEGKKPEPLALGAQTIVLFPSEIIERINKGRLKLVGHIGNG